MAVASAQQPPPNTRDCKKHFQCASSQFCMSIPGMNSTDLPDVFPPFRAFVDAVQSNASLVNYTNGRRGVCTPCLISQAPSPPVHFCAPLGQYQAASITGQCPAKCGTQAPTAATTTPAPTPRPLCRAHRDCSPIQYCKDNRTVSNRGVSSGYRICDACQHCNRAESVNHVCPRKCNQYIYTAPPSPSSAPSQPTAQPTTRPPTYSPTPLIDNPNNQCNNHRRCPITDFCNQFGRCVACTDCQINRFNNSQVSFNGQCPRKCTSTNAPTAPPAPTARGECGAHYQCTDRQYCTLFRMCRNCSRGDPCNVSTSINGACPLKCNRVLSVAAPMSTTSAASSSSSAAVGAIVGVVVAVVATVAVVVHWRRSASRGASAETAGVEPTPAGPQSTYI